MATFRRSLGLSLALSLFSACSPAEPTVDETRTKTAQGADEANGKKDDEPVVPKSAVLTALKVIAPLMQVPVSLPVPMKAIGIYDDKSEKDLTATVAWSWDETVPLAADPQSRPGWVVGRQPGAATITAKSGAVQASASFDIVSATVVSLRMSQVPAAAPAGGSGFRFAVEATYSNKLTADITAAAEWTVDDQAVAKADATDPGFIRGVAQGTTKVRAFIAYLFAAADVEVLAPELRHLFFVDSPAGSTYPGCIAPTPTLDFDPAAFRPQNFVGRTLQIAVVGYYSDCRYRRVPEAELRSSQPAVAAFGDDGSLQLLAAGTTELSASLGPLSAPPKTLQVQAVAAVSLATSFDQLTFPAYCSLPEPMIDYSYIFGEPTGGAVSQDDMNPGMPATAINYSRYDANVAYSNCSWATNPTGMTWVSSNPAVAVFDDADQPVLRHVADGTVTVTVKPPVESGLADLSLADVAINYREGPTQDDIEPTSPPDEETPPTEETPPVEATPEATPPREQDLAGCHAIGQVYDRAKPGCNSNVQWPAPFTCDKNGASQAFMTAASSSSITGHSNAPAKIDEYLSQGYVIDQCGLVNGSKPYISFYRLVGDQLSVKTLEAQ